MLLFDHLLKGLQKCVLRYFPAKCWKIDLISATFLIFTSKSINDKCLFYYLKLQNWATGRKISMVRLGNVQNLLNEISCLPVCVLPIYDQHPPSLMISTQSLSWEVLGLILMQPSILLLKSLIAFLITPCSLLSIWLENLSGIQNCFKCSILPVQFKKSNL